MPVGLDKNMRNPHPTLDAVNNIALKLQLECAEKTGYPKEVAQNPKLAQNIRISGHVAKAYADCVARSVEQLPVTTQPAKPSASAPQSDSKKLFGKPVNDMVFYGVIGLGILAGGFIIWKFILKK